jgi:hypothetical protein
MPALPPDAALSLHELSARLGAQISAADGEIGETRAILKDAIDRLMPAFLDENGVLRTNESAFSALQFQDISDQQLAHAQQRLRALSVQVARFVDALDGHAGAANAAALAALVVDANDTLTALDLTLAKPVSTPHLGTGEMELF